MREAGKGALHGAGTGKALGKEGPESQQWKETHGFVSPLCPTFPDLLTKPSPGPGHGISWPWASS